MGKYFSCCSYRIRYSYLINHPLEERTVSREEFRAYIESNINVVHIVPYAIVNGYAILV